MLRYVQPQVVLLYEDNFNFLSKMCLGVMRKRRLQHDGMRHGGPAPESSRQAPTSATRRRRILNAGADVALIGEGLAALFEVLPRLDSNPTRR